MKKLSEYFYFNFEKKAESHKNYDNVLVEIIDDVVKKENIFITNTIFYLKNYGSQTKIWDRESTLQKNYWAGYSENLI